jgi:hypothetical protein
MSQKINDILCNAVASDRRNTECHEMWPLQPFTKDLVMRRNYLVEDSGSNADTTREYWNRILSLTCFIIELVTSSSWSKALGTANSCYASSILSLSNKEPMYVMLVSNLNDTSICF